MIVTVTGIGLWSRGLHCWDDFVRGMNDGFSRLCPRTGRLDPRTDRSGEFEAPKPQAIPPRERRRAGLTINLAVEVTHQACEMAGIDKASVGSVFTSAMGDTDITDYLCRKLAGDDKLLSPTQFHNSVHNAPSGYWSISAANRQPSNFAGGFLDSFAGGMLEAAACASAEHLPVVLTAYDIANRAPFGDVLPISETLGLALLMLPGVRPRGWRLEVNVEAGRADAAAPRHVALRHLADANPIGTGLALLEAMAVSAAAGTGCRARPPGAADRGEGVDLRWPVGSAASLHVRVA